MPTPPPRRAPAPWRWPLLALALALVVAAVVGGRPHVARTPASASSGVHSRLASHPPLSDAQLRALVHRTDPAATLNYTDPQSLLSRLLITREPATPGNRIAREAIDYVFAKQLAGWTIEHQPFTAATPLGPREMVNLVYTKHLGPHPSSSPDVPTLTLAAHYDSKYYPPTAPEYPFIGATDSAAPCAMLVDVALALDKLLEQQPRSPHSPALQFIFFDGEEAYHQWTQADSIYGARQLAGHWSYPPSSAPMVLKSLPQQLSRFARASAWLRRQIPAPLPLGPRQDRPPRRIDQIEHLVLLDLLGTPNPSVPSYFPATGWLHARLMDFETRLRNLGLLFPSSLAAAAARDGASSEKRKWNPSRPFLSTSPVWGGVEDDHIPFLHQGVPVLHLIPNPFPSVWHRRSDDRSALHYPTVRAWSILTRVLAADYLGLAVPELSP